MSIVEDVRQVFQDFLAPELRALSARIEALEVKMDSRFEANEAKANSRFEALNGRMAANEERASLRHEILLVQLESIKGQLSLDYRLKKLEQAQDDPRA